MSAPYDLFVIVCGHGIAVSITTIACDGFPPFIKRLRYILALLEAWEVGLDNSNSLESTTHKREKRYDRR